MTGIGIFGHLGVQRVMGLATDPLRGITIRCTYTQHSIQLYELSHDTTSK